MDSRRIHRSQFNNGTGLAKRRFSKKKLVISTRQPPGELFAAATTADATKAAPRLLG